MSHAAASPPDVRYHLSISPPSTIGASRHGFAAGCEIPSVNIAAIHYWRLTPRLRRRMYHLSISPPSTIGASRRGFVCLFRHPLLAIGASRRGFAAGCEAGAMPRRPDLTLPNWGCAPRSGYAPKALGQRPDQGHSPRNFFRKLAARQSLASHPAAKPWREAPIVDGR